MTSWGQHSFWASKSSDQVWAGSAGLTAGVCINCQFVIFLVGCWLAAQRFEGGPPRPLIVTRGRVVLAQQVCAQPRVLQMIDDGLPFGLEGRDNT